jgi:hypothetical protein
MARRHEIDISAQNDLSDTGSTYSILVFKFLAAIALALICWLFMVG